MYPDYFVTYVSDYTIEISNLSVHLTGVSLRFTPAGDFTVGHPTKEINLPEPKSYELYLSFMLKLMIFGVLGLFTVVGVLLVSGVFLSAVGNSPPMFFGILWLGMVGWNWYWILSFPHKITISETGQITFISLLRRRSVSGVEIESIKPSRGQFGFLVVKTANRKIRLLNQFDGFHEFIINLKSINPSIELRGC